MKTQSAKAKGRKLQKLVVAAILKFFPYLTERDVQSRAMGSQGTDVVMSEKAFNAFPMNIECKMQETNKKLLDMWEQTKSNSKTGHPLLVISANRSPVLAILELEVLMAYFNKSEA